MTITNNNMELAASGRKGESHLIPIWSSPGGPEPLKMTEMNLVKTGRALRLPEVRKPSCRASAKSGVATGSLGVANHSQAIGLQPVFTKINRGPARVRNRDSRTADGLSIRKNSPRPTTNLASRSSWRDTVRVGLLAKNGHYGGATKA